MRVRRRVINSCNAAVRGVLGSEEVMLAEPFERGSAGCPLGVKEVNAYGPRNAVDRFSNI